jgi:hypothetical protein
LKLPGIFLRISQFVQKRRKKIGKLKRKKAKKSIILHISYKLAIASKYFIKKKKKIFPEDVY